MRENSSEKDAPSMGQWARDIADTYRELAAEVQWPLRRAALTAEAAKYDSIAASMDRIRVLPPEVGKP